MATYLIVLIYLSFVGMGLTDTVLGPAWTTISATFNVDIGYEGIITFVLAGVTVIAGLSSGWLVKKVGIGRTAVISLGFIMSATIGYWLSPNFVWFLLFSIPLGLGAGILDNSLNNYVAVHYHSHHMNWLHCFWGVGALIGPLILSGFLAVNKWRGAYLVIAIIQFVIFILLFINIPNWVKMPITPTAATPVEPHIQQSSILSLLRLRGMLPSIITVVSYCAVMATINHWGASFLELSRGVDKATAARCIAVYFLGVTIGRFFAGFIAMRLSNKLIIRISCCLLLIGALLFLLPLPSLLAYLSTILLGLGSASIFPSLLYDTPRRFGVSNSQQAITIQMVSNSVSHMTIPALSGFIASRTSFIVVPIVIILFSLVLILSTEALNKLFPQLG